MFLLYGVLSLSQAYAQELPAFPPSFTATIEANIVNKNYTLAIKEYFDAEGDRTRVESHRRCPDSAGGENEDDCSMYELRYYALGQKLSISRSSENTFSCTVDDLMGPGSGQGGLPTSTEMFEGHRELYVYQGVESVRGILCDWWRAEGISTASFRTPGVNTSYSVDYYFAQPQWDFYTESYTRPVRAVVDGCHLDVTTLECTAPFMHNYEYIGFSPHVDIPSQGGIEELFRPPGSAACPPLLEQLPLPLLPDDFSVVIEADITAKGYSVRVEEYYDYSHQRTRQNYYYPNKYSSTVKDFSTGYQYSIVQEQYTDRYNCSVRNITGMETDEEGHLKTAKNLFELHEDLSDWTYQGTGYIVRGITASLWTAIKRNENNSFGGSFAMESEYLVEWYFVDQNAWNYVGGNAGSPVPLRTVVSGNFNGTSFKNHYEWVNFIPGSAKPLDDQLFDLPPECFLGEEKSFPVIPDRFQLRMETSYAGEQASYIQHSFFDYSQNTVRHDKYDSQGDPMIHIYYLDEGVHLSRTSVGCTITQDLGDLSWQAANGHVLHADEIFRHGLEYTYSGRTYARGIVCDRFTAVSYNIMQNDRLVLNMTQDWYFAVDSWGGNYANRVMPVKQINTEFWLNKDPTGGCCLGTIYSSSAEVNIFDFQQGTPSAAHFEAKAEWRCPYPYEGVEECEQAVRDERKPLVVATIILGLVLVVALVILAKKSSQLNARNTKVFQKFDNEDVPMEETR